MPDIDPKVQEASNVLVDNVYVPAFCKQCADRGIEINSMEDLQAAMQNVMMLKAAQAQEAEQGTSLHKQANAALLGFFGEYGQPEDVDEKATKMASEFNNEQVLEAARLLASLGNEGNANDEATE